MAPLSRPPLERTISGMRALAVSVVDLVYPPHCHACGRPLETGLRSVPLCHGCASAIRPVPNPCPLCGTPRGPHAPGGRCPSCHDRALVFRQARGVFPHRGPVHRLLHRLKFEGFTPAEKTLARLAADVVRRDRKSYCAGCDVAVPMPSHWRRAFSRGFNPSALMARRIARELGLPLVSALVKTRQTPPQSTLDRAARMTNLEGALAVKPGKTNRLHGRNVLLFDDVVTTSTTANEASKALLDAGAASVTVLAVARQTLSG